MLSWMTWNDTILSKVLGASLWLKVCIQHNTRILKSFISIESLGAFSSGLGLYSFESCFQCLFLKNLLKLYRRSIKLKMWIYLGFGPNMRSLKTFFQISQADLIKFWIWFVSIKILQQIVTNDIQLGSRCKMQIKVLGTRSKSPWVLRRIKLIYGRDD